MSDHFSGRVALVTGGSGGIGAKLSARLAAVNLRAPFLLARGTLPGMRARGFGRILFTSSVAALAVLRNGYVTSQVFSVDGGMHPG